MQQKYQKEAQNLKLSSEIAEKIVIHTQSPSNIALVKYWGKRPIQLPQNPSISFSLSTSKTKMEISYIQTKSRTEDFVDLYFEDKLNPAFGQKIQKYLLSITKYLPFLSRFKLEIKSNNTFPHSSGIASSASSMSALALNLCLLERKLFGTLIEERDFLAKASFLARLASGSASRSVYAGFTIWGESIC
jgi:diphosphomevalonate decarboxylase